MEPMESPLDPPLLCTLSTSTAYLRSTSRALLFSGQSCIIQTAPTHLYAARTHDHAYYTKHQIHV